MPARHKTVNDVLATRRSSVTAYCSSVPCVPVDLVILFEASVAAAQLRRQNLRALVEQCVGHGTEKACRTVAAADTRQLVRATQSGSSVVEGML
jgi:hypothetical protein